jgi:hypothetical protein
MTAGLSARAIPSAAPVRLESWQQTPGGRMVIGVIVSVGLCYGLLQLAISTLRGFVGGDASARLSPSFGILMFLGIQVISLIVGGAITGIGQRRGMTYGALVGLLSGLLILSGIFYGVVHNLAVSFGAQLLTPGTAIRNIVLYALPILHVICGAIGGLVGRMIWRPMPEISGTGPGMFGVPAGVPWRIVRRDVGRMRASVWEGPIHWVRVLLGTAIAVAGAIYAKTLIDIMVMLSQGTLKVVSLLEDQVTFAEIFSLAIMLGGCVAGANTRNGLKQGVCVGIGAALVIDALFMVGYLNPSAPRIYPILSTLFLGPIGGWFGSELLPPILGLRYRRKRRMQVLS